MEAIVSTKWLNENLNKENLIVLNASQKDNKSGLKTDFEKVQIKGSIFFDLKNIFSDKESDLPNMLPSPQGFESEARKLGIHKNSKIVVYDNIGIFSSPRVWWMFKVMGHDNVSVLNGGLPKWKNEGYEIESFQNNLNGQGDFEVRYKPEMVKSMKFIKNNLKKENAILIDARSEDRFNGIATEPREDLRSGHIPKSINIPFQKVLDDRIYKSRTELSKLFKDMCIDDRPLTFTCGSGLTACIVLLASELIMKNHKSIYDGSWTEWAQINNQTIVGNKIA